MYSTGIIKKIDNLGRIVLPKEIRRKLKIRENDELEIFLDSEETILLKKYSTMKDLKKECALYASILNKETGFKVMFTDKDKVTVCKGKNTSLFVGEEISDKLIDIIEKRMIYNVNLASDIKILRTDENLNPKIIIPLIVDSKSIGSIVLFTDEVEKTVKDKEYELLKFVASLISTKLEI